MKKILYSAAVVLLACLWESVLCFASPETDILNTYVNVLPDHAYYTIPEWNIMIIQPEEATCTDEGDGFYIYTAEEGYIPFVVVTVYEAYDSEKAFFADYTEYMNSLYENLEILAENTELDLARDVYYEVDYAYFTEDVQVVNRCIAKEFNGSTYLFASEEVPDLGLTVGSMLEDVVTGSYFLADNQPVLHGTIELRWGNIVDDVNEDGGFVQLPEVGLVMFIPNEFEEYALTQEDEEDFFI